MGDSTSSFKHGPFRTAKRHEPQCRQCNAIVILDCYRDLIGDRVVSGDEAQEQIKDCVDIANEQHECKASAAHCDCEGDDLTKLVRMEITMSGIKVWYCQSCVDKIDKAEEYGKNKEGSLGFKQGEK